MAESDQFHVHVLLDSETLLIPCPRRISEAATPSHGVGGAGLTAGGAPTVGWLTAQATKRFFQNTGRQPVLQVPPLSRPILSPWFG